MKLNLQRQRLVILLLCVGLMGVASVLPNPVSGCESAIGLVHISDVATHKYYRTTWAEIGARPYTDHPYQISQITPGLAGGVLVRTANNDKWFRKERLFKLTVDQDAFVYVCFDQRAAKTLPEWLKQDKWEPMPDESIVTSDWSASPMVVYGKTVKGGIPLSMPGNQYGGKTGARSNYFAIVTFDKPGSRLLEILAVSSNRPYRVAEAKRHARHYIDRKYRIRALSPELEGGVLVRTANNDKWNKNEEHLRLYTYKPATLYVAYDKRGAAHPPQWLADWETTDLTMRTGDYRASPMVVFRRDVQGDEIVDLGGNHHGWDTGARSNYVVVAVPDEQWKRKALMVVGRSRLNFSDALVKSRLENRGFSVMVKDDDEVVASDGDGKHLILLSESVYSKRIKDMFADAPVPIICWEPYLFDDLGMTGHQAGIDFGYEYKRRKIHMLKTEHPMAGNVDGDIVVTNKPTRFGWAIPYDEANVVATLADDKDRATVFYYDAEPDNPDGFPALRIGLFFDKYTPKKLNANGRRLLEAAFDTALGVNSLKIFSDNSWKAADEEFEEWMTAEFDDSDWRHAAAPYPNRMPANSWFRMPGTNAQYMWDFPGGGKMTGRNGPGHAWFRKKFDLPVPTSALTSATVTLAVDDVYDLYVNGEPVLSSWDSPAHNGLATVNIRDYLVEGGNVLAIYASDAYRGYEWALVESTIEWESVVTPEWTIMVYLNGDNENHEYMAQDLHELEHGLFNAMNKDPEVIHKLKLVALYDGPGQDDSVIYEIQPDPMLIGDIVSKVLSNPPEEFNMGDPQTLQDFIGYCQTNYDAKQFALILANHGEKAASQSVSKGGIEYTSSPAKYILWDYNQGSTSDVVDGVDRLYVAEVTQGLMGMDHVHVLGLDTGFMGTLETAFQFVPDADNTEPAFLVASPGQAVPEGWEYTSILDRLSDVEVLSAEMVSETIIAAFEETYQDIEERDATLSAYNLALVPDVKYNLDLLASEIGQDFYSWYIAIRERGYALSGPNLIEYFDDKRPTWNDVGVFKEASNWLQTPLFDLYDFSVAMGGSNFDAAPGLTEAVEQCVLKSFVKVNKKSSGFPVLWNSTNFGPEFNTEALGLAFFFPDGYYRIQVNGNYNMSYWHQWWYTASNTEDWESAVPDFTFNHYDSDPLYGGLNFCEPVNEGDWIVDTWRELLEYWFDPDPSLITPGGY